MKNERILIIGAHPDDEVLGCGGIINRFYKGNEICVFISGEGSSCRCGYKKSDIIKRQEMSKDALAILSDNDSKISFGSGICGNFRNQDINLIKSEIESIISDFDPTVVFSHYNNDNNLDHNVINEYTRIATRPYLNNSIHSVYQYEVLSSTDRAGFNPNVYFTLSEENINLKIEAMNCFNTEQNHASRTGDGLKTLAKFRGFHIGKTYAESFILESMVK